MSPSCRPRSSDFNERNHSHSHPEPPDPRSDIYRMVAQFSNCKIHCLETMDQDQAAKQVWLDHKRESRKVRAQYMLNLLPLCEPIPLTVGQHREQDDQEGEGIRACGWQILLDCDIGDPQSLPALFVEQHYTFASLTEVIHRRQKWHVGFVAVTRQLKSI